MLTRGQASAQRLRILQQKGRSADDAIEVDTDQWFDGEVVLLTHLQGPRTSSTGVSKSQTSVRNRTPAKRSHQDALEASSASLTRKKSNSSSGKVASNSSSGKVARQKVPTRAGRVSAMDPTFNQCYSGEEEGSDTELYLSATPEGSDAHTRPPDDKLPTDVGSTMSDEASVEMLRDAALHAQGILGEERIGFSAMSFSLVLNLDELDRSVRRANGIHPEHRVMKCNFDCSQGFRRTSPCPSVSVELSGCGDESWTASSMETDSHFPPCMFLTQALVKRVQNRWSRKTENFLQELWEFAQHDRLLRIGHFCMLCDKELDHPGLRLTICENYLCAYQHAQLGIGATLREFDQPIVADLLVTLAFAAASKYAKRKITLPSLPYQACGSPMQGNAIRKVLQGLPSVAMLASMERKAMEALIGPGTLALLRWIFGMKRSHIKLLENDDRLIKIGGQSHFEVLCDDVRHSDSFAAEKKKYGSSFAFHGSPLYNWHSVLRTHLKNLSNTPYMSGGASYGAGVYLTRDTATALSFAQAVPQDWAGGTIREAVHIIAIVEYAHTTIDLQLGRNPRTSLAAHTYPGNSSGHLVAGEDTVQVRYLILGTPKSAIHAGIGVEQLGLRGRDCTNSSTFRSRNIDQISGVMFWLSSDRYGFEICELAEYIRGRGAFINPHTSRGFIRADVDAIIAHRSERGRSLRTLEQANERKRRSLRMRTVSQCHIFSRKFEADGLSQAEALVHISDLPAAVVRADAQKIGCIEFEYIEPDTGRPARDTIDNITKACGQGIVSPRHLGALLRGVSRN